MPAEVKERLKKLGILLGCRNRRELAYTTDCEESLLSQMIFQNKISKLYARAVAAKFPQVSAEFLLTGKGTLVKDPDQSNFEEDRQQNAIAEITRIFHQLQPANRDIFIQAFKSIIAQQEAQEEKETNPTPPVEFLTPDIIPPRKTKFTTPKSPKTKTKRRSRIVKLENDYQQFIVLEQEEEITVRKPRHQY